MRDLDGEPPVSGAAAGGLVRVELDAAGRVVDVVLDAEVRSLPLAELSSALVTAFRQAQAAAGARAEAVAGQYGGLPSGERLVAASEEATADAERRFNEISTVLHDLERRAGRQW
jgi:hypothetical protein